MRSSCFCVATFFLCGCGKPIFSDPSAFQKNDDTDVVAPNSAYDFFSIVERTSAETGVPKSKINFRTEVLKGFSWSDVADSSNVATEVEYTAITQNECEELKKYHSQGYKLGSRVNCARANRNFTTSDFAPPPLQALNRNRFVSERKQVQGKPVLLVSNCWTTSYEIARFKNSGEIDFHIFYVGSEINDLFKNNDYFENRGTTTASAARDFLLANARPGELVQFFKKGILHHSAVWVSPGILFEKTGPWDFHVYRFVSIDDALALWSEADTVALLQTTQKVLPHPRSFSHGDLGSDTRLDAETQGYTFMARVPNFTVGSDGRYALPVAAYQFFLPR